MTLEEPNALLAFEAALQGDPGAAMRCLDRPELGAGWRLALRSVIPKRDAHAPPSIAEAQSARDGGDTGGLLQTAVQCARLAFARHDADLLLAWRSELAQCDPKSPLLVLLDAQHAWLEGGASVDLGDAEAEIGRAGMAASVVDTAVMRSLLATKRDDARHHARRAVRMSRTEELPFQQYLAGFALARARRFDGQSHMALRILGALQRVAPERFSPWLNHELRMAGDSAFWPGGLSARLSDAQRLAAEAPSAALRRELETLMGLLDPSVAAPATVEWRRGETREVPYGLLALETSPSEHHALALFDPDGGVRVLASAPIASGYALLSSARPGRLETALAVLGLARRPLSTEEFFAEVYGFAFEAQLHRGALEVVVHRIRDMLGERATIHRDLGTVAMVVHQPFAVPDPRVQRSFDDTVLRALAQHPDATARQSAEKVGAPLRSVQHALKRLVEDGVCEAQKRGRVICYRIEDTTFTEPTRVLDGR